MKKTQWRLLNVLMVIGSIAVFAGTAYSQDAPGKAQHERRLQKMDADGDGLISRQERRNFNRSHRRFDNDNNPPGRRGGPGTNWENPPGKRGGPGASPDRRARLDNDDNPPGRRGGPGTNWENPPGRRGGPGASPD